MRTSFVPLLVLVAVSPCAAPAQEDDALVAAAVESLGDPDWTRRVDAEEDLVRLGAPALAAAEDAAGSDDPEVSHRARRAANRIRLEARDREGVWEILVQHGPWTGGGEVAQARFLLDGECATRARWTTRKDWRALEAHATVEVRVDGLAVVVGPRRYVYDARARALLSESCVGERLDSADGLHRGARLGSRDPFERREALWRLARASGWEGVPELREVVYERLADTDPLVRAYAAAAAPGGDDVRLRLRRLLSDPDPLVRSEAAEALGRVGRDFDRTFLEGMLEDTDPGVREHARDAIHALETRGWFRGNGGS